LNEETRNRVVKQLDELRDQVSERLGADPSRHDPVAAHVAEVRALVHEDVSDRPGAHAAASGLEKRLLAWEAEHPQLVSLASRLARALEDAGL
jgi:hypothetical protein